MESQAKIIYKAGDIEIIGGGNFIITAPNQEPIYLDCLLYWNVERQEAYLNAEQSLRVELEHRYKHLA